MAPPQSYLDTEMTGFSRYVNLTDTSSNRDGWHGDFSYFGANVYAYLLSCYGDSIDLVSVQFYESFSRAGKAIHHDGMTVSDYLIRYVCGLGLNNETLFVDFSKDPEVGFLGPQSVSLPLRKLVFGLGNGWTGGDDQRAIYMAPDQLELAWNVLADLDLSPRGFMFWSIMQEGVNGIYLARELDRIMHKRR
jgi:hypothetical protein